MLTFGWIQMTISEQQEVLEFIFIFQKDIFYYPFPINGLINIPK